VEIMQIPVEISFRKMDRSLALTAEIQAKANKRGELYGRIIRCYVVIEALHWAIGAYDSA
jgi:hypothetical protein